jgi:hypothetical protein
VGAGARCTAAGDELARRDSSPGNTYTTVGYGNFVLPQGWEMLAPIIAMSGLYRVQAGPGASWSNIVSALPGNQGPGCGTGTTAA